MGCAYLLQGKIEYAMGNFRETIERNPFCKEAQNDLGVACYIAGKPSEAATHFQAAYSRRADFLEPLYNLGLLSWQIGRDDEAREYFKKYLQLDGTSVYAEVARNYLGMAASNNLPSATSGKINRPALAAISALGKGRWNEFVTSTVKISVFHAASQDTQFFQCLSKPAGEKIYMLLTTNSFQRGLEREISISAPSSLVDARLPYSHAIKPSTQGAFWVYEDLGLVFEMRNQKVHNWYWYEIM
ncbi:MAG: tetratricopeptide repeat protein [bacterium]